MRNDFSNPLSDDDRDDASDLTQQFWGSSQGWISGDQPAVTPRTRRDTTGPTEVTGSIQAIRDGFAAFRPRTVGRRNETGQIDRTRSHGIVRPSSTPAAAPSKSDLPHREATIAQLGAGWFDDDFDEALAAVRSRRTGTHAVTTAATVGPDAELADDYQDTDYQDTDYQDDGFQANEYRDDEYRGNDPYDIPLTPTAALADRLGLAAVDPILMRIGIFVLALALLLPIAWSLRGDDNRAGSVETNPDVIGAGAAVLFSEPTADQTSATDAPLTAAPSESAAPAAVAEQPTAAAVTAPATAGAANADASTSAVGDVSQVEATGSASPGVEAPATVDVVAERQELDCSLNYTAGPGDSWYRIADAAGVTPAELLAANLATVDTVIFPGDEICLPTGATVPSPPTTTPSTTEAPSTTQAPATTAAPTTAAPTTTEAPAPAPPPPTSTTAEVQALIREVWPDELEEKALVIAYRESNYQATADNGWCCVGVFQIYWTVHQSWLDDYGIYSRNDLKDARKNITAAYALYQRAGGWGPWGG